MNNGKTLWMVAILFVAGIGFLTSEAGGQIGSSRLGREEGAIYLEDLLEKPIQLTVNRTAPIFYQLDGSRRLGTVTEGTKVTLLALSDRAYRVRGKATHADVAGWIGPDFLDGLSEKMKEDLQKVYERQLLVEDLISKRQVALGMTMDEVERSMGRPTKTSSKLDQAGRTDSYEYVTYKRVPQYNTSYDRFGRAYTGYIYVNVETGRVTITFENEMVTSIEEKESDPAATPIRTVPAPIELAY